MHSDAPAGDQAPSGHWMHHMDTVVKRLKPIVCVLNVFSLHLTHPMEESKAIPCPHTHLGSACVSATSAVPAAHRQADLSMEGSVMYGHTLHPLPDGLYRPVMVTTPEAI